MLPDFGWMQPLNNQQQEIEQMAKKKKPAAKGSAAKKPAVTKPTEKQVQALHTKMYSAARKKSAEKQMKALKELQARYAKVPKGSMSSIRTSGRSVAVPTDHLKAILRALEVCGSVGAAKQALEAAEIVIKQKLKEKPLSAEVQKRLDEYIDKLPKAIPKGKILVHNHIKPNRVLGGNGFRAWITEHDPEKHILCSCDWAKRLGWHYWMRSAAEKVDGVGLYQGE